MNTRTPESLDDEERELARILHALPAGEPSPSVDAAILRAAQNALAGSQRRKRLAWGSGWLSLGGLSTAAAAVLTVGVTWQIVGPALRPPPMIDIQAAPSISDDALSVDITRSAPPAEAIEPVEPQSTESYEPGDAVGRNAPSLPSATNAAAQKRARETIEQALPPPAVVADTAHSEIDEHITLSGARVPPEEEANAEAAAPAATAPAPTAGMTGSAARSARTENGFAQDAMLEKATSARTPEQRARDDLRLQPNAWIRKVRSRIAEGDVATARISLRYFAQRHPEYGVPNDLKDLLEDEP